MTLHHHSSAGAGGALRGGLVARVAFVGLVLAGLALACYRPRVVDCVLACDDAHGCPATMTCSDGLCTRGATCALAVAAGARHSCAIVGNQVECWGNNSYGQLGIDSTEPRGADGTPFVPVDLGAGRTVAASAGAIAIAAGGRHTCALTTEATSPTVAAVCWGDNTFGQLGLADRRARGGRAGDTFDVVPLPGGRSIVAITAGLCHTCARLDDGSVVCWGDNRFGQLGVPGGDNASFTPVHLNERAIAVSAGAYHSCALLVGGAVQCWGWNDYMQLGAGGWPNPSSSASAAPPVNIPPAKAIAAGGFHSCAVLQTGAVTCWGQADGGQLGVMTVNMQTVAFGPGQLVDLGRGRSAQSMIAAGASHTCALLDDFSVKCWGFNGHGELGIGDSANRGDDEKLGDNLPRVALGSGPVSALAVGANHACVIQTTGVRCWGCNDSGRLGVGDEQSRGADSLHPIDLVHLGPATP